MAPLSDNKTLAGYCELEHTADWQLRVWAPDFLSLLVQAARGMYALAGMQPTTCLSTQCSFKLSAQEDEVLLVRFLNELLYIFAKERLVFSVFDLVFQDGVLVVNLSGAPCLGIDKEIKAVTYHNLVISAVKQGLETTIVFDV